MLKGKTVVLGVTGGIAAYKIPNLASMLVKLHADVHVLMTKNAVNFIHPTSFETLTGNKCLIDTFDRHFEFHVEHVSLAKKADIVLIAPATANVLAKMAHGIADDMLTTTVLACNCKKIVSPAMNTRMLENPVTQDNIRTLKRYGFEIIQPFEGHLACGDLGPGKMPEPDILLEYILREIAFKKDMTGLKVLVTAGPTLEAIDPVRFISNHSTGKMGYAMAKACMLRGADVTLISGKTCLPPPLFVNLVPVISAQDMYEAVLSRASDMDLIIKAAAVADYRPAVISSEKIKKGDGNLTVELQRNPDILAELRALKKDGQFLLGFAMETENMLENARQKLKKKNLDMIAANDLKVKGAGFGTNTNVMTLITEENMIELPCLLKEQVAHSILDQVLMKMSDNKC